ncbi:MAG: hypothetical protein AB7V36_12920 [Bacteroidales bacterium]
MVIKSKIDKLVEYIKKEDYKGYDPYDALSSSIPFNKLGKYPSWAIMQFQLRNPFNIRPLLGIKKHRGAKSIALILESYINLYKITNSGEYLNTAKELYYWLLDNRLKNFEGNCWAIHFPVAWTDNNRPENDPSSVLACFVFNAVFELYKVTKEESIKETLLGITKFIQTHVPVTENEYGICYSYTTRKRDIVFNANMLVAEVLAKSFFLTGNEDFKILAEKAVEFNLHFQKEDGRWNYKYHPETQNEKVQIDFHQGFMVLSLSEYKKFANDNRTIIDNAINKGLQFYETQFGPDGAGYYRFPNFWPIDIHNQAVGIITFARLYSFNTSYLDLAALILKWTDKHLYERKKGYYYYRKYKFFRNKISYMRWSQSWMLLALTYFELSKTKK